MRLERDEAAPASDRAAKPMIALLIVAVVGMLLTLFVLAGEFSKESDSTTATPITRQTIPNVTLPPDPTVPTVPTTTGPATTDRRRNPGSIRDRANAGAPRRTG